MSETNTLSSFLASQSANLPPAKEDQPIPPSTDLSQFLGGGTTKSPAETPAPAALPPAAPGAPSSLSEFLSSSKQEESHEFAAQPPEAENSLAQFLGSSDLKHENDPSLEATGETKLAAHQSIFTKAWDWANEPLFGDPHKLGITEGSGKFVSGVEEGLEDIVGGLTTPISLGLLAATFGGSAVEEAGVFALGRIGVSKAAAPIVIGAAKSLLGLGFSAQMISGLVTQSPQFLSALENGDVESATRLGTNMLATGVFLTQGLKHGIEDAKSVKNYVREQNGNPLTTTERLKAASEASGYYNEAVQIGNDSARAKAEEITRQLKEVGADKDPIVQAGIRHYMTQDGDVQRIGAMIRVAEGIKPREYTPEEIKQQSDAGELRKWVSKSLYKDENGKPIEMYVSDSVPGTHQLGQTLSVTGEPGDKHYVRVENPISMRGEANLAQYIKQSGGEAEAKEKLQKAGYDGITYQAKNGTQRVIAFNNDQYRSVADYEKAVNTAWNREHAYIAVETKNLPHVLNSGIGVDPAKNNAVYSATPDEALKSAALPASGSRKDLTVLSVPRAEIEADTRESNAKTLGKIPREAIGPVKIQGTGFNPHEEMKARLVNPELVDKSIVLRDPDTGRAHPEIAIPVGGDRVSGAITAGVSESNSAELMKQLEDKPGFPDLRLTKNNSGDLEIQWGQKMPWREAGTDTPTKDWTQKSGRAFGYKPELIGETSTTVPNDMLVAAKRHMPAFRIERNENGDFTGRSTPLRPEGEGVEGLPEDTSRYQKLYTQQEKDNYIAGLRKGQNLAPEEIAIAKSLRQLYDNSFQKAYDNGLIRSWVESYHPQSWANSEGSMWKWLFNKNPEPVKSGVLNMLRHDTDSGRFDTDINSAKHRVYNTEFEGVMAGEKFKSDDLTMHAANHLKAIDQAIAARKFIDDLRKAKAGDRRPGVVMAGTTRVFGDADNPALAISPNSIKPIHINPDIVEKMSEGINPKTGMSDLESGLQQGIIHKLPWTVENEKGEKVPAYAYNSEGYRSINHPAMRGWGYAGQDTAGAPAMLRGDMMVHPDFAKYVERVLGAEKSAVKGFVPFKTPWGTETSVGTSLLKASGQAKGTLLGLSPFHLGQLGLRGMLIGIKPWEWPELSHVDISKDTPETEILRRGVRKGLIRNDWEAKDQFSAGFAAHSKLIGAIPGIGQYQDWLQNLTFNRVLPVLKDEGFMRVYKKLVTDNPGILPDRAASLAADTVNDALGSQNWKKLGVSASLLDGAKLTALAPDWLISEARFMARAAGLMDKETGTLSRKMLMKQVVGLWVVARIANGILSGNLHEEAPFGVAVKKDDGSETVYSLRSLPGDMVHAVANPEDFLRGRMNPIVSKPAVEFLSGRNQQGRKVTGAQQVGDVVRNVVPIAVQGLIKGNALSGSEQLAKGLGASVYKYRTPAEDLIQRYSSDHNEQGPVDPDKLAAHQRKLVLQDQFLQGQISKADLTRQTSVGEANEIAKTAHMTPLQNRFYRIPLIQEINAWSVMSAAEKASVYKLLEAKINSWMESHKPEEREREPEWAKIQSLRDVHF